MVTAASIALGRESEEVVSALPVAQPISHVTVSATAPEASSGRFCEWPFLFASQSDEIPSSPKLLSQPEQFVIEAAPQEKPERQPAVMDEANATSSPAPEIDLSELVDVDPVEKAMTEKAMEHMRVSGGFGPNNSIQDSNPWTRHIKTVMSRADSTLHTWKRLSPGP